MYGRSASGITTETINLLVSLQDGNHQRVVARVPFEVATEQVRPYASSTVSGVRSRMFRRGRWCSSGGQLTVGALGGNPRLTAVERGLQVPRSPAAVVITQCEAAALQHFLFEGTAASRLSSACSWGQ